jgi:beta-lactamase class A
VLKEVLHSLSEGKDLRLETLRELGLIAPRSNLEATITTQDYASIFRLLYNSPYLSVDNSEKILSLMAISPFDSGLVAGVPADIKVANKFGERFNENEKQLHDCGIIYYPGNPYLLCVMTKGDDWNKLTEIISAVSKIVYDEVHSRRLP